MPQPKIIKKDWSQQLQLNDDIFIPKDLPPNVIPTCMEVCQAWLYYMSEQELIDLIIKQVRNNKYI